jgi:hypothetical protein
MPVLFAALAMGCSETRLISGGPFSGAVQTPESTLRYALGKSVVTVEATVTRGASGQVTFNGTEFSVDTKLARKDANAVVQIRAVPDDDQFYTLRLEHGGSSDDSITVDVAPNGLLRFVGVESTSEIGTTIKSVVTVASSVAAAIAAATLGPDPRKQAIALVCEKLGADAGTPGRCPAMLTPDTQPAPAPTTTPTRTKGAKNDGAPRPAPVGPEKPATDKPATGGCDKRTETSLADLSMANLYFLASSQKGRRLWLDRRDAEARLTGRVCRRAELERQAERAVGRDLEEARAKLMMAVQLEAAARADLQGASDELDLAVKDFQLRTGIDSPPRTEAVAMVFDLDEIPPPDILRGAVSVVPPSTSVGMTETDVRNALKPYPRVLELYERTGLALTITPPPYIARGGTVWVGEGNSGEAETRIYYRPSYTAVLTTYATTRTTDAQGGQEERLTLFSVASDEVLHRKMPTLGFAFKPEAFAQRRLGLGFDEKGRLVRYEQAGRSSVVGAATTAAESMQIAREEYAQTLTRIADLQDVKRRLQTNDLITKIDQLQKQRDLVDARLELEGTRSNYDLLLEKKRLDAEIGVAQGRQVLSGGGDDSSTQITQQLDHLTAKLEELARQVDALQHRDQQTPLTAPGR